MKATGLGSVCAAFLATFAAANSANAFDQSRTGSFGESYGNSNVHGSWNYRSSERNVNGDYLLMLPGGGSATPPYLESSAQQSLTTTTRIFGKRGTPFSGVVASVGKWRMGANGEDIYSRSSSGSLTVMGSKVWSGSGTACEANRSCLSVYKAYERKIVSHTQSFPFFLGLFSFDVTGSVNGSLNTRLTGDAHAASYMGMKNSLYGRAYSSFDATAGLTAHLSGCFGICKVVAIGANVDFTILEVSVAPSSSARQATSSKDATYDWSITAPLTVKSMAGELKLTADYLFDHDEISLVKWDGYEESWTAWDDAGDSTCTGYKARVGECRDVVVLP